MAVLSAAEYERRADATLLALRDAIDALGRDDVSAELGGGVLTLEFADASRYVANTQRAASQLWLAAGRRAWHFDWDAGRAQWVALRSGDELWSTLEALLTQKLRAPASLGPPR